MNKLRKLILSLLLSSYCVTAGAAQYFTSWDEFSTGAAGTTLTGFTQQALGASWTYTVTDLGGGDHIVRVATSSTNAQSLLTYDPYDGSGDMEVVTKLTLGTTGDQNAGIGPALIAADGRYYAWRPTAAPTATLWRLSLFSATGTVNASIGSDVSFTEPTAGSTYWIMVGRSGSTIYGSLWITDGTRPGSPMSSASETTLSTVKPGLVTLDSSDDPMDFLLFGAGNGGSAAPESDPGPPPEGCVPCLLIQQQSARLFTAIGSPKA